MGRPRGRSPVCTLPAAPLQGRAPSSQGRGASSRSQPSTPGPGERRRQRQPGHRCTGEGCRPAGDAGLLAASGRKAPEGPGQEGEASQTVSRLASAARCPLQTRVPTDGPASRSSSPRPRTAGAGLAPHKRILCSRASTACCQGRSPPQSPRAQQLATGASSGATVPTARYVQNPGILLTAVTGEVKTMHSLAQDYY